jgi:ABC-type enterochelin transport system substrate-binding protein
MKNILIALVIVVIVLSMILGACSKKSGETSTSKDSTKSQSKQVESHTITKEPVKNPDPVKPADQAETILKDMDRAEVKENTEELRDVIGHLNNICKKAVETRDAMLTAKYKADVENKPCEKGGNENADK